MCFKQLSKAPDDKRVEWNTLRATSPEKIRRGGERGKGRGRRKGRGRGGGGEEGEGERGEGGRQALGVQGLDVTVCNRKIESSLRSLNGKRKTT